MPSAHDVARYILDQNGRMTAMKLQKLCYYAQAWSLVWDEDPLFAERIEAWANGPVCRNLYASHRGMFDVASGDIPGDPATLNDPQRETVDAVLNDYGERGAWELANMTHSEQPWLDAREGLDPGERGENEITHASMAEFYGSLYDQKER